MTLRRRTHPAALTARPQETTQTSLGGEPGVHALLLGDAVRDGRLFLPGTMEQRPCPLMLLLHGAGADGSSMLRLVGKMAGAKGCALLAPDARQHTWDFLVGGFGPDVTFLDRALRQVFERCHVDASRVALAGFSDGASYALTLGLANGDLFTHVMAFSPGFMRPPDLQGTPRVFMSHGTEDRVLPIERCSRRIFPQLKEAGYHTRYREFAGPHTLPDAVLAEALAWFTGEAEALGT